MRGFRRQQTPQQTRQQTVAAAPPATSRVWVAAAYGPHVDTLVSRLSVLMEAATTEALMPSTAPSAGSPGDRTQNNRQLLWNDLKDLQSVLIRADVSDEDVDRDRRLRAAVSTAVGAACNLALASSSQPTAGYLGLTRTAVDGVLDAAGRRALA